MTRQLQFFAATLLATAMALLTATSSFAQAGKPDQIRIGLQKSST